MYHHKNKKNYNKNVSSQKQKNIIYFFKKSYLIFKIDRICLLLNSYGRKL